MQHRGGGGGGGFTLESLDQGSLCLQLIQLGSFILLFREHTKDLRLLYMSHHLGLGRIILDIDWFYMVYKLFHLKQGNGHFRCPFYIIMEILPTSPAQ